MLSEGIVAAQSLPLPVQKKKNLPFILGLSGCYWFFLWQPELKRADMANLQICYITLTQVQAILIEAKDNWEEI